MTKFVVDLGDVPVSDDQKRQIAGAIHAAVAPHIANLKHPGGGQLLSLGLPAGFGIAANPEDLKDTHDGLVSQTA